MVTPMLEERNIGYTTFFNAEAVDTERKVISSMEGEDISYDILVLIPPHRGAKLIEESGLGDEQGWIPTDRNTLEVKGHEHIYAIGDATDLPVSKSGSAAHFEAKVLATRLVAAIRGEELKGEDGIYDGEVMCFLETGTTKPPSWCSIMSIRHVHHAQACIIIWRNNSSTGLTGISYRKDWYNHPGA